MTSKVKLAVIEETQTKHTAKPNNTMTKQTSCDVGMDFGKFREYSVKIGNDKKHGMPSGKRRLHSVSSRHNDDR